MSRNSAHFTTRIFTRKLQVIDTFTSISTDETSWYFQFINFYECKFKILVFIVKEFEEFLQKISFFYLNFIFYNKLIRLFENAS